MRLILIACLQGVLYFGIVFTFAFVTGVVRVLLVAPWLGSVAAVLLEVPILIAASWMVARYLLRDHCRSVAQRIAMGTTAFAFTMAAEAVLSWTMRGETLTAWASSIATPLGLVGLFGQIVFGAMPLLVGRSRAAP